MCCQKLKLILLRLEINCINPRRRHFLTVNKGQLVGHIYYTEIIIIIFVFDVTVCDAEMSTSNVVSPGIKLSASTRAVIQDKNHFHKLLLGCILLGVY